mmetsp:Transcript_21892/g.51136  ORF Transcript_21892/g.51136 Transcript_21892/m.51136 type:complete len:531 (-) Transcript_21892:132-1724(-)|eukprot:CAMPEP_0178417048 /NCGR_PEP_ID=MMETSP0689_2-20121128/24377_1 /TAXON_ID=160604 /ORGANISM="Amphidinium massartii, Strain CS-259" /LENGTH=530 /DNA_ID=CAMNT_0020038409 /DNA_START=13 /DNA_END=1605 /DNA_ORIENTATION=-
MARTKKTLEEEKTNGYHRMGPQKPTVASFLDEYFEISARGSSLTTEVRAGCIGWMTMSYIMLVNPVILSKADVHNPIPLEPLMTATALSAAFGSLLAGLMVNMPFGLMPGMGLNAYFTFGICHSFDVTRPQAMSCCVVSGALLVLLSLLGVCEWIVNAVLSDHLKKAITAAIGVFQALIGFQTCGLVVASPDTLLQMGDFSIYNQRLYVAMGGFILITVLLVGTRVHGALLIGMLSMAVYGWTIGIGEWPSTTLGMPEFDTTFDIDLSAWNPANGKLVGMVTGSLVLLFVSLFDLAGVQYGLASIAGLLQNGSVRRSRETFCSAGMSTMVGGLLGTSPVIIANESSASIVEGGRTGLCSVVMAVLFALSTFLAPIICAVPNVATAVPLVIIGAFMMAPCRGIDWDDLRVAIPSFLTMTVVPFTYSIHNGILAGLFMDIILKLMPNPKGAEQEGAEAVVELKSPFDLKSPHVLVSHYQSPNCEEKARSLLTDLSQQIASFPAASAEGREKDEALRKALEGWLEEIELHESP